MDIPLALLLCAFGCKADVAIALRNGFGQATQALVIGRGTAQVIVSFSLMLYLLFFFLRNEGELAQRCVSLIANEGGQHGDRNG
jgi:predicted PurR-regulated permease PerM